MDPSMLLGVLFRWMHILAAITAVGGTIFMRMALLPSVGVLGDDARKSLHEAVRGRWAKFVMGSIAFLLISGLYNIAMIEMGHKIPAGDSGLYHALFGVKFLLAFGIFFIASALVGRSPAFAKIRQNARYWLTLNMTLAILVVCISGVLRAFRDKPATSPNNGATSLIAPATNNLPPTSDQTATGQTRTVQVTSELPTSPLMNGAM